MWLFFISYTLHILDKCFLGPHYDFPDLLSLLTQFWISCRQTIPPSDYTAIFGPLGSCSLTFEEWLTVINLKLCFNLSDFNTHIDDSSKTLASQFLELLSSSEPVIHPCHPCKLPHGPSPIPQPLQHFNFTHPAFWQLLLVFHLLPLGPQLHPPFASTIHCSSHLFLCLLYPACHHFFPNKLRCLVQSLSACPCFFPWTVTLSSPNHNINSG